MGYAQMDCIQSMGYTHRYRITPLQGCEYIDLPHERRAMPLACV